MTPDEMKAEIERLTLALRAAEKERDDRRWMEDGGTWENRALAAEAALADLKGVLQTESNERIRCRDGWALEAQRSEAALARVAALEGALGAAADKIDSAVVMAVALGWGSSELACRGAANAARALLGGAK